MSAKQTIQTAVEKVEQLRQLAKDTPGLAQAVSEIKAFQAKRFTGTYFDLLHTQQYQPAAQFFLEELYSEKDYSQRDAQFSRIAGTLERMFPKQVVQTALTLAQLHCLTEDLDMAMAQSWLDTDHAQGNDLVAKYVTVWRDVGRKSDRKKQLSGALAVGKELVTLTSTPGLRLALKMMRKPASLAGMADLQHFLESGFDTFAAMEKEKNSVNYFLKTVEARENKLLSELFASSFTIAQDAINDIMNYAT
ncbi:MAG: hypothetical protein RL018_1217 [Pseudomonadota bacterium]